MARIIWDCDGVLRALSEQVVAECCPGTPIDTWNFKDSNGHNIYYHIEKDLTILERCKPTKYFHVPMLFPNFEIWTVQPEHWRKHTMKWIKRVYYKEEGYMMGIKVNFFDSPEQKYQRLQEEQDVWSIEDSPNFPSYDRVILIHQEYNKQANAGVRTCDPKALEMMIARRLG